MPFRFSDEKSTADVAFEAWGKSQEEVFVSCAAALLHTMVDDPDQVERQQELTIKLEYEELDLLLWLFLQELVFYKDARRLLVHADRVQIEQKKDLYCLEATARGEEIDVSRHHLLVDVKAVTLHGFRLLLDDDLWKADVVLDV